MPCQKGRKELLGFNVIIGNVLAKLTLSSSSGRFCFLTTPTGNALPPRRFPTCTDIEMTRPLDSISYNFESETAAIVGLRYSLEEKRQFKQYNTTELNPSDCAERNTYDGHETRFLLLSS